MEGAMFEVYSWPTPNGHKIHIMLEECGLPYRIHPIDIGSGAQFDPDFLAISPNNKIPALRDADGPDGEPISLFESAPSCSTWPARLGLWPAREHAQQVRGAAVADVPDGGVGPMLGQAHHFRLYAPEKLPYAIDRYTNEAKRLYGVINKRLARSTYLGGPATALPTSPPSPGCVPGRTRCGDERLPAPQGLVRRDRQAPRRAARPGAFEDKPARR